MPLSLGFALSLFTGKKFIGILFRPKQRLRIDRYWLWYFPIISPTSHCILMHVKQRSYVADGVKIVIYSSHYLTHCLVVISVRLSQLSFVKYVLKYVFSHFKTQKKAPKRYLNFRANSVFPDKSIAWKQALASRRGFEPLLPP